MLLDYGRKLKQQTNRNSNIRDWLEKQQVANSGLPCELLEIQSLKEDLDKCVGYRNKCEFTIGKPFLVFNKH